MIFFRGLFIYEIKIFMKSAYSKILAEYEDLSRQLASASPQQIAKLGKRQVQLLPVIEKIQELQKIENELAENKKLAAGKDQLAEIAEEELKILSKRADILQNAIDNLLVPADPLDEKNIIVEIRAGAGGNESTLFAAELFRTYAKYAEKQKWATHIISANQSDLGGYKEVVFEIKGRKAYSKLKFESGVHRVQRVPETEKSGRVHTSTVTVAVLPEFEELDIEIPAKDLEITANTSSGHGGQSVNTTYSAIKITHIPTGITAQSQDERSQAQNREKALTVLRSRVAQFYRQQKEKEYKDQRRTLIGSGGRSEKIRTYNFPQDRITDHRINKNFHQINTALNGNLEPIINALTEADMKLKNAA